MKTVLAPVLDELGQAHKRWHLENRNGAWETRNRTWATPATEVRRVQAARIPVDLDHNHRPVGEVVHLERVASGALFAVAHVDERVDPERPTYWSAASTSDPDGGDVEIEWLSLTFSPAALGLSPLKILDGKIDHRAVVERWSWRDQLTRNERELITRAAHSHLDRGRGEPLVVHDGELDRSRDGLDPREKYVALAEQADAITHGVGGPPGKLRYRPGRILNVR
jgi:hypothetical protein